MNVFCSSRICQNYIHKKEILTDILLAADTFNELLLVTLLVAPAEVLEVVFEDALFEDGLSNMFESFVTLNSDVFVDGGTKPLFNETSSGSASSPANHSSADNAGIWPTVSGYKSSWNSSDCGMVYSIYLE